MTLLYLKRYSRIYIRTHSDWLFVYGDNLQRTGLGGQAAEARGECNAIGIATKRSPSMDETAFLTPRDYDEWFSIEKGMLSHLMKMSKAGRTIIWPLDGIGTGLAQLEKRAPNIWDVIEGLRMSIE